MKKDTKGRFVKGGESFWKGKHLSAATRKKLSDAHKGKPLSEAHKEILSNVRKGKKRGPFSETWKDNIRKSRIGKKASIVTRLKMSESNKGTNNGFYGKRHSLETRNKLSEQRKGAKSTLWRGGLRSVNAGIRASLEYRLWRESVFKRDDYTCQECGVRSGDGYTVVLNADHIKPFAYFPGVRFSLDNGRTLCVDCHKETSTFGVKSRIIYEFKK
jgi:hypothetical protein